MTIGFLFGAGFSKALHPSMPVVKELLKKIDMPKGIPHAISGDLEQVLSYLWTNYPWNTEMQHLKNRYQFLDLNQQIYKNITMAENQAWLELYANDNLRVIAKTINSNSIAIWQARLAGLISDNKRFFSITINYDTLLERLMMMYNDANLVYPAPLQNLRSIWNQSTPNHSSSSDILRYLNEFKTVQYPNIYKLHGSISWYSLDPLETNAPIYVAEMDMLYALGKEVVNREIDNALTSIIVPPVADKSSLYNNKVLRSQWIGASKSLQNCDTLYCVGYSFPTSDLPMELFLGQACRKIKHVVLVNLEREEEKWARIKRLFADDVEVEWITGDECVKDMAYRLFEEESL